MIFFNILEARKQLLDSGKVYTLRRSHTSTGVTFAVTGSIPDNHILCKVIVTRIMEVSHPDDLQPFLDRSGFNDIDTWLSKASPRARTLYEVVKSA